MPTINVTLKKGAGDDKYEEAKKQVTDQGGKIKNEYTTIKAFTAEVPDDKVSVLQSNDNITVENDGEVKTQ